MTPIWHALFGLNPSRLPPAERLSLARLRSRLDVVIGIVGESTETTNEASRLQARRLAGEVVQELARSNRRLTAHSISSLNAKVTASEVLILEHLSHDYIASLLRDSCMDILVLLESRSGEHVIEEKRFVTDALLHVNSAPAQNQRSLPRLYLQARQRLDSITAAKAAVTDAADQFLSTLWLRTLSTIIICLVPIIYFVYDHYWLDHKSTDAASEQSVVAPSTPMFDVQAAQDAQLVIPILQADLKKLPKASKKPQLDLNDIREIVDRPPYKEFTENSTAGKAFVETVARLATESNAPPELTDLGTKFAKIVDNPVSDTQRRLLFIGELRAHEATLAPLNVFLTKKIEDAKLVPTPSPPAVEEKHDEDDEGLSDELLRRKGKGEPRVDPIARMATVFSVIMMGVCGAFVSNFSRVCALLRDGAAISTSLSDSRLRVKFSPFLGGLLAIVLAEIFAGHLLQGDLFPITEKMPRWLDLIWHGRGFSKLLVWAFVAGLSENHVLRLLSGLVGRLTPDERPLPNARG